MPHQKSIKWCSRRQTDRMMWDNTSNSTSVSRFADLQFKTPHNPYHSNSTFDLAKVWQHFTHTITGSRLLLLCIPQSSCYWSYWFSEIISPHICGSGPRILNDVKWHLQEQSIQYNYPSFIWKCIKARRNKEHLWKMMHTGMMDRGSTM